MTVTMLVTKMDHWAAARSAIQTTREGSFRRLSSRLSHSYALLRVTSLHAFFANHHSRIHHPLWYLWLMLVKLWKGSLCNHHSTAQHNLRNRPPLWSQVGLQCHQKCNAPPRNSALDHILLLVD